MSVTNGNRKPGDGAPTSISSIPLTEVPAPTPRDASIGDLVRDATAQVSTLFRAEVELAKAEVTGEVKKGLQGSLFFILALAVLIFSSFFFFFFLAELLDIWVARWLAFLIVFLIMVLVTAIFALIGYLRVRKVRAPNKTIDSLKQAKTVLPMHEEPVAGAGPRHAR
ncbi:phage holin family protein [Rhodococcus phenolicus]|uniref:phage holin family protein n=1 Tax=Rhodococcus phenolicus TaxID=263849 RepID=UPI00082B9157|nr:phage holin family protein [Rhodococcus phenolicus]